MTESTHVVCPHCSAVNRIPADRPASEAKCGGCKANLFTGEPMSGDLDPLEVRQDGAAYLVTTTDAFTRDDLLAGSKTAILVHGADGSPDADKRFACGVIGTG